MRIGGGLDAVTATQLMQPPHHPGETWICLAALATSGYGYVIGAMTCCLMPGMIHFGVRAVLQTAMARLISKVPNSPHAT